MKKLLVVLLVLFLPGCGLFKSASGVDLDALRLRLAVSELFVFWRPAQGNEPSTPDTTQPRPTAPAAISSGPRSISRGQPAPAKRRARPRVFPLFKRRRCK